MPTNIEAKFRCPDLSVVESLTQKLTDSNPAVLLQVDTYFEVVTGRLKLREFADGPAELIGYSRSNAVETRPSDWCVVKIDDPDSLKTVLCGTCGIKTVVSKKRKLYLIGQTRIHLDEVERLGSFVEIEVVLSEGERQESGQPIADQIVEQLGLNRLSPEPRSYSDLMMEIDC